MNYGQVIGAFEPFQDKVYGLFTAYFGDPDMYKIKNVGNFSVYMTKVNCLLTIEFRYIVAFVQADKNDLGTSVKMSKLPWVSLQTRTMEDNHQLPVHNYLPRRLVGLDQKITLVKRDEKQYIYKVDAGRDLPIQVTLLSKGKDLEYNNSGSVVTALETYQTIINFV